MWKSFFYLSKRERRGMLILIVFIAGVFFGKYLFTPKALPSIEKLDLQLEKETINNEAKPDVSHVTSSSALSFDAESYRPYREQRKQSEKRTYYRFPEKASSTAKTNNYPKAEKLTAGMIVDINRSDTAELMKIPGIGSSFAKRIVGYRNILGGFYRIEQLQEVYGMYEELYEKILPYIKINSDSIRMIVVHSASIDKLKSHPYINFYQAKAIVETREKRKIGNINELSLLEEFTDEDMERIRPYLDFEK
jgi:competence ComEA-like helix-hairpin-helix protein